MKNYIWSNNGQNFPVDKNYKPTGLRSLTSPMKKHKENHTKTFYKLIKNNGKEKVIKAAREEIMYLLGFQHI